MRSNVVWSGSQEGTATRIGVEVAAVAILAIIAVVVFNPSLGPSVTALVVVVLVALDAVTILALLGLFPRIRSWLHDRSSQRRLNRHPTLVPEMIRLVQRTQYALYENAIGSLLNVSRTIYGAGRGPAQRGAKIPPGIRGALADVADEHPLGSQSVRYAGAERRRTLRDRPVRP